MLNAPASPDLQVRLAGPIAERRRFSDREAAPSAVNKVLVQSSLEASIDTDLRELPELSGANESIRGGGRW